MIDKQQIISKLKSEADTLSELSVNQIGVFGSVSRGESHENSDIDFLVALDELTYDNYATLKIYLEDWFNSSIDLVLKDDLRPELRDSILAEVVYAEVN